MTTRTRFTLIAGAISLALAARAHAWWDTIVKKWTFPPLVASYEAEALADRGVTEDELVPSAKAVLMEAQGPELAFTRELAPGPYGVYIYGRSPREADRGDPGGMSPFYFLVTMRAEADGNITRYRVRAAYQYVYTLTYGAEDMARVYFRIDTPGEYRFTVNPGEGSTGAPLLVDRVELRAVLGNCAGARGKTARTMIGDEELRNLRGGTLAPAPALPAEDVLARCEACWASFPPPNAPRQASAAPGHYREKDRVPADDALRGWKLNALDQPLALTHPDHGTYTPADYLAGRPLPGPLADDGWGVTVTGLSHTWGEKSAAAVNGTFSVIGPLFAQRVKDLAARMIKRAADYERTGDPEAGLEGAALLLAFAWNYPLLDYRVQAAWPSEYGRFSFANHIGGGIVSGGLLEGHAVRDYIRAYDRLYDVIAANPAFAKFLAGKVAWVKTADDVIRFLDVNLLQRTADVIMRGDVAGDPLKMSRALTMAAVCQGINPIGQAWVDVLFDEIPMGMIEPGGLEDMAYGGLGRDGLVSKGSGGYSKGSIMSFLEVAASLREYRNAGGRIAADLTDLKRYPWFGEALYAPIDLRAAGGWVPLIGDYGDPLRTREVYFDRGPTGGNGLKPYYLEAWRLTGDPRFAFLTRRYGRSTETEEEWALIETAAEGQRDPLNTLPSRVMDDFGLAVLETGQRHDDFTKKRALTLRYGHGHTHGHNDGLAISVFGKGMRAISDLAARAGSPNPRLQKMHNTVEVDGEGINNGDVLAAGWGWLEAFAPMGEVQFAEASQRARSHPQLETYRRGAALIDVDSENSYVFDVFRVAGGAVHTWAAHANQNDRFEMNAELAPAASPQAKDYLAGFKTPETTLGEKHAVPDLLPQPMEGVAPDALVATWRLHPRAEQAFLHEALPEDGKVFARRRLFGHGGDRLMVANGTSDRYRYDMSFLYVQRTGVTAAGSVYPALAEVYQGAPVVQAARALTVEEAGDGAAATVAVEVALPDGVTDVCLSGTGDGRARSVEGKLVFDGRFGFVRRDGKGLVRAHLVGGTMLRGESFSIELPSAATEAEVVATQPDRKACTVKGNVPAELVGRKAHLYAPSGRCWVYTVKSLRPTGNGATEVAFEERMKIFQSALELVDEDAGTVSVVAEPYNLKADQRAYDFTEAANESLTKRWPADVVCDSRWMVLKTPIRDADVPDHDGDGRRTITMFGNESDKENNGKPLLALEVTRVDEDASTFFFRMPAGPYDIGGWDYVGRNLVSESGRTWRGTYPGFEYKVKVDGAVKAADFDDADGDGRSTLSLYRFRPGFRLEIPAYASVLRTESGVYRIEAGPEAKIDVMDGPK